MTLSDFLQTKGLHEPAFNENRPEDFVRLAWSTIYADRSASNELILNWLRGNLEYITDPADEFWNELWEFVRRSSINQTELGTLVDLLSGIYAILSEAKFVRKNGAISAENLVLLKKHVVSLDWHACPYEKANQQTSPQDAYSAVIRINDLPFFESIYLRALVEAARIQRNIKIELIKVDWSNVANAFQNRSIDVAVYNETLLEQIDASQVSSIDLLEYKGYFLFGKKGMPAPHRKSRRLEKICVVKNSDFEAIGRAKYGTERLHFVDNSDKAVLGLLDDTAEYDYVIVGGIQSQFLRDNFSDQVSEWSPFRGIANTQIKMWFDRRDSKIDTHLELIQTLWSEILQSFKNENYEWNKEHIKYINQRSSAACVESTDGLTKMKTEHNVLPDSLMQLQVGGFISDV